MDTQCVSFTIILVKCQLLTALSNFLLWAALLGCMDPFLKSDPGVQFSVFVSAYFNKSRCFWKCSFKYTAYISACFVNAFLISIPNLARADP